MTRRDERGLAASVEAAVVLPALVLFVGLLLTFARIALADQSVGSAAAAGARAASLERTPGAGQDAAASAVAAALAQHGLRCAHTDVTVDTAGLSRPLGQLASVRVSVTCQVSLADVSLPLIPGQVTVEAARTSPIDPLRGR
ncbi:TadE-like protein [Tessaracoccus bendigoensis DSM 12906]|uniref:TadE-like protein n=1 Tax=Tessaracoccus bendigoensis DSM 12906 TaxID=1123357 RepID=A0A1M6KI98_9ACTN|nr:TadE/TadG family type IV pilus assembly protein [Tessaracoccus bendigoensis]SHJ58673.1 TadE-like protein [Tessaracoccus bendigoensis DSM 12906]